MMEQMASTKKQIGKKKERKTRKGAPLQFNFKRGDWLLIPVIPLVVAALYGAQINMWGMRPAALFVAAFGTIYLTQMLRRKPVLLYVRLIAYLLSSVLIFSLLYIWAGGDLGCTGFMGVQTTCASANAFTIAILFLNPYSQILWGVLSIAGMIGILTKAISHSQK